MAIHMALDLGMNVSSENWSRAGTSVFNSREREIRERTWYGCIHLEKWVYYFRSRWRWPLPARYMSMYLGKQITSVYNGASPYFSGRPVRIQPSSYNLKLPTTLDVSQRPSIQCWVILIISASTRVYSMALHYETIPILLCPRDDLVHMER